MNLDLSDKNVLVVGASKGIGKEIAIAFAKEGAILTTIARSENLLKYLENELNNISDKNHKYYICDLMNYDITSFANKLLEECGIFDIIVHNIGGSLVSRNALGTLEEWEYAWKFNAGIAIALNNVLLPPLIKKKWGRVIHISSISAQMLRGNPLYASAKAFLNAKEFSIDKVIDKHLYLYNKMLQE
jgi:3-oxoacyl-[acyl-carrier protein] reductase